MINDNNFIIPENTDNNYVYNYVNIFEKIFDYSINGIIPNDLNYDDISNNIIYDLS